MLSYSYVAMPYCKQKAITEHYGIPFNALIKKWYLNDMLSGDAIAKKINKDVAIISITSRAIYDKLKEIGISRNKSSSRVVGIRNGRVNYDSLRKPIKSVERRKGISLGARYGILKRDNFRCAICGSNALKDRLIVDHITPIVRGGTNAIDNLRTLCTACNHGKMIYEHEK